MTETPPDQGHSGMDRITGLIAQQRARARAATRSARVLLALLVVTVLFGLAFYLGQPFFRQWVEGERVALDRAIRTTQQQVASARSDVEDQLERYQTTLRDAAYRSELPKDMSILGVVNNGPRSLVYGTDARVLSLDAQGRVVSDDTMPFKTLIVGDRLTLTPRVVSDEPRAVSLNVGDPVLPTITSALSLENGQIWFFSQDGQVVEIGDFQGSPRLLPVALGDVVFGAIEGDGGVLAYGERGAVFLDRSNGRPLWYIDNRGESKLGARPHSLGRSPFNAHVAFGDRILLVGRDRNAVSISRSEFSSEKPDTMPIQPLRGMTGFAKTDSSILFYSDNPRRHPRILNIGDEWSWDKFVQVQDFLDVIPTTSGWAGISPSGVLHFDENFVETDQGGAAYGAALAGGIATDVGTLVFGKAGTLDRERPDGTWEPLGLQNEINIERAFPMGERILLARLGGGAHIYGNDLAVRFENALSASRETQKSLETGVEPDLEANFAAIDGAVRLMSDFRAALEPHNQARGLEIVAAIDSIASQAQVYRSRLTEDRARQDRYRTFPYSLIWDRDLDRFGDFMATCRAGAGEPAEGTTPAPLTLACLEGWEAEKSAEREGWWQALAVQVPPGILLLFLLATLGGLYRYNLRMAGFHSGRADALELLSEGVDAHGLAILEKASTAFAADAVSFGKVGETPSDQAVKLAQALRG